MGKYDPLRSYLASLDQDEWLATFARIEEILGFRLPPSARDYHAWWGHERNPQSGHKRAWVEAGWRTTELNLTGERIVFRREKPRHKSIASSTSVQTGTGAGLVAASGKREAIGTPAPVKTGDDWLPKAFHGAMVNVYHAALKECGYRATRFLRLVQELGGYEAALRLLSADRPSHGLTALWEHKRLDLSMEALVLEEPWCRLFAEEELWRARKRLEDLGRPAGARDGNRIHDSAEKPSEARETVALVSCVKSKRERPAKAKDLYTSALFRKSRAYVEAAECRWYVLSALHGLVFPDEEIAPYDVRLKDASSTVRKDWAEMVLKALVTRVEPTSRIVMLAGDAYARYLVPMLEDRGYTVEQPLEGLRIGERMAKLAEMTDRLERR